MDSTSGYPRSEGRPLHRSALRECPPTAHGRSLGGHNDDLEVRVHHDVTAKEPWDAALDRYRDLTVAAATFNR